MKHSWKITILLLSMFIVTQLIGLYVINYYSPVKIVNNVQINISTPNQLPLGLQPPVQIQQENGNFWTTYFPSLIFAFIIAISLFFVLTKFKAEFVLKAWFFIVVIIALSISILSFFPSSTLLFVAIALVISIPLAFIKIYKQNFFIHNLTELFIYPGIAAVFVSLLTSPQNLNRGVFAIIALLILISIYDMWAVWHSGIMQKMAKYQINQLKIFSGFFIPYVSKRMKLKLQRMKKSEKGKKKIKVNIALLGGGDVIFPTITAGVVLMRFGFTNVLGLEIPLASLLIILGAALGLGFLFLFSKKRRFYPAMPFISIGIFVALGLCYLLFR